MRSKFVSLKKSRHFKKRNDFVRYALRSKVGKLLDVGNLGDGVMNVDVKNIVEENKGEHFGLDVNKNLADSLGYKNQRIGDLHNLSGVVKDEEFNTVYAGEIIEHTWKPGEMISECNRILCNGGRLVLDTPNVFTFYNVFRVYFKKRDTLGLDNSLMVYNEVKDNFLEWRNDKKELLSQPQHKILYSPTMMRQLLNMHGFEVEEFCFIGNSENFIYRMLLPFFLQEAQKFSGHSHRTHLLEHHNL